MNINMYSLTELKQLYNLALDFNHENSNKHSCDVVYRDKDKSYFTQIHNRVANNGTMVCYRKDEGHRVPHGDRRSPINPTNEAKRLNALFFSANRDKSYPNSGPPKRSIFGNERFTIDTDELIDIVNNRFYFGDFYCVNNGKDHYITIVVTNHTSTTPNVNGFKNSDAVCRQSLPEMQLVTVDSKELKKYRENVEKILRFMHNGKDQDFPLELPNILRQTVDILGLCLTGHLQLSEAEKNRISERFKLSTESSPTVEETPGYRALLEKNCTLPYYLMNYDFASDLVQFRVGKVLGAKVLGVSFRLLYRLA